MDMLRKFELGVIKAASKPSVQNSFKIFTDQPRTPESISNSREFRSLPLGSVNGVTNAESVASMMDAFVNESAGVMNTQAWQAALRLNPNVLKDEFMNRTISFSDCGLGLDRFDDFGCEGWVGWGGMGGSLLVFHPSSKSSFAYIPNGFTSQLYKARGVRILREFTKAVKQ
jgi:hypothetical protein